MEVERSEILSVISGSTFRFPENAMSMPGQDSDKSIEGSVVHSEKIELSKILSVQIAE